MLCKLYFDIGIIFFATFAAIATIYALKAGFRQTKKQIHSINHEKKPIS